jgi:S1-C subfamily serine protease
MTISWMSRNLRNRAGWVIGSALILLTGAFAIPAIGQRFAVNNEVAPRPVTPRGELSADEKSTIDLFQRARASVVYINTRERLVDPWTRNMFSIPRGTGSGFVWDGLGHIVTNFHVIAGVSEARVRLSDGRDSPATLVGASPDHDLAVLRLNVSTSPSPVAIGTSQDLRVGQKVFAIGNPFGLDWTLTTGIISALDRSLPAQDGRTLIEHLIQTDAAINPGNSGGPLLDSAGRLIGVNTAIFSPSGASSGVGFAVPIDTVNRVVPQLIARGKYTRPSLGIAVDEGLNRTAMEQLRVEGVLVLQVTPGSPAAAVGLRGVQIAADGSMVPGDIIVAIDGRPVESVARLLARLDDRHVGDGVRLTILRDSRRVEVTVTLVGGA